MSESGAEQSISPRNTFVGRERELAELVSACESGADSDTHLFLIYGEPGIGKTRLADELASRAKSRGMNVLWGRCWEGGGAPAYWPWIQVIRSYLAALDPERRKFVLESELAYDTIHEVAQIIPDLRRAQSSPRPRATENLDPTEARFRLFDAVTSFLKIGARVRPLLILLDDLHDADEASLALLRFMARELKGAPIIVVATYRDREIRQSPELGKLIGEMSREGHPIPMSNLSRSEVMKFVQVIAGRTPDDALVAKLMEATNGNPLFVDGVVRGLIAESALDWGGAAGHSFEIPSGLREAIGARLAKLSKGSNGILAVAAAIGKEFEFAICQSVAEVSGDEAHRLLDEATRAGIVTAFGQGRLRFSHSLIRDAVYDELDAPSRIATHRKIAERMEELYRADIDAHLPELADHFREARIAEKAIDYSVRAGRAAASVFAFNDAMTHQQAALELMEQTGSDALGQADLLFGLAGYAYQVDRAVALKYGESAIALYEGLGRFDLAAQVHLLLGMIFHMRGEPLANAARATDHLRRAESAIAHEPESTPLANLYCIVASNESAKLNFGESAIAAQRAMEISARLGDKKYWPWAAVTYAWSLCMNGRLREGFALFERSFEAACASGFSGFPAAWGAGYLSKLLGDPRGSQVWFERELNRKTREASPITFNSFNLWIDLDRFDRGYLSSKEQKSDAENASFRFWNGGEWETLTDLLEMQVDFGERTDNRLFGLNQCVYGGFANLLMGKHARAEALFRYGLAIGDRAPEALLEMRSAPWLARLYIEMNRLDEAAEQIARCQQIMTSGEDWRGLAGNVAIAEGVVAAERGNYDIAYKHFESALAIHQRYHLAWGEAHTLQYWGRALAAAGDRARAAKKFDAALENHRSRGVGPRFLEWLMADKMRALGASPTQIDLPANGQSVSAKSNATDTFRREGEFWTVTYADVTVRLKDAKGLRYIAYLLAHPGERFHVLDLILAVEGSPAKGRTEIHAESEGLEIVRDIGTADALLDAQARSEYRTRLRELQSELDEVERMNDIERAERLRTEIEMVGMELKGSSGVGVRARSFSSSAERARGMVGRNIRSVLRKIRQQDPGLGRHLAATISTGYFCAYQPDPDQAVSWQFK